MSAALIYERNDVRNFRPSLIASEEAALPASARAGDLVAFENLVMPQWRRLLRVTERILRNREDAEDAVQTALLDAFRNLKSFQGRSGFSSWPMRIAINAAYMRLRVTRRKRETSLDEIAGTEGARTGFHLVEARPNPEQKYLLKEGRVLLEKRIKRLGPVYVEILHLRSTQELSTKEAAGFLDVPVETVKARLRRARLKLSRYTQRPKWGKTT